MNDLISIVIPVYNVENYIDKCLESVLNQTYKNIEIIIVNDGSTDSSLERVNSIVKGDSRASVFSKPNGGLSSARNLGIEKAHGKYISFIDSDDWVDRCFIEKLYKAIRVNNSDIAICNMTYIYQNGEIKKRTPVLKKYRTVSSQEALADLFNSNGFRFHAVNKLYRTNLFIKNNIRYPLEKIYEDVFTTYKLFIKSKKITYFPENLYFYLQSRPGSILNTTFNSNRFQIFEALAQIKSAINNENESIIKSYYHLVVLNVISLCNYIYPIYEKNNKDIEQYGSIIRNNVISLIGKSTTSIVNNKQINFIEKVRYYLIINHFDQYLLLMKNLKHKC